MIWRVHKADTIFYISICVDCGYIRSWKLYLFRHTLLAVSLAFIFLNDLTSEKSRHYVLSTLLCWFGAHLVVEKWLKQTPCVIYFTNIDWGCFTIIPVGKLDTMWWLIYCVDLDYIWSLKFDLSRHSMSAISLRFFWVCFTIWQVKKAETMC